MFERLAVVVLFIMLVKSIAGPVAHGASIFNLLILVSEGLVVLLVMLRRPAIELSTKPVDWLLAFGASAVPTLLRSGGVHPLSPPAVAGAIMLVGIIAQVACKLALLRSFGVAPANRGLVIAGPYRFVRHPIYASYIISQAGFLLLNPTAWNVGVLAVNLMLQILRIGAEERVLAHDPGHAAFCKAVPYRLVPLLF